MIGGEKGPKATAGKISHRWSVVIVQKITKSSLVLQAQGCDDCQKELLGGEDIGRIIGASEPSLNHSNIDLQKSGMSTLPPALCLGATCTFALYN